MAWQLKSVLAETKYTLTNSEFKIGRDRGVDLVCINPVVSKKHATIYVGGDSIYILDHKSSNGTYVNNVKIGEERHFLNDMDEIGFGMCTTIPNFFKTYKPPYYVYKLHKLTTDERTVAILQSIREIDESLQKARVTSTVKRERTSVELVDEGQAQPSTSGIKSGNKKTQNDDKGTYPDETVEKVRDKDSDEDKEGIFCRKIVGTSKVQTNDSDQLTSNIFPIELNRLKENKSNAEHVSMVRIQRKKSIEKRVKENFQLFSSDKHRSSDIEVCNRLVPATPDVLNNVDDNPGNDQNVPIGAAKVLIKRLSSIERRIKERFKLPSGDKSCKEDLPEICADLNPPVPDDGAKSSTHHNVSAFSNHDDVIVIDDNDDDIDEFMCSQMFVKEEVTDDCENNNFSEIKKELAYMDNFDEPTDIYPVNEICENEYNTMDLLRELGDDPSPPVDVNAPSTSNNVEVPVMISPVYDACDDSDYTKDNKIIVPCTSKTTGRTNELLTEYNDPSTSAITNELIQEVTLNGRKAILIPPQNQSTPVKVKKTPKEPTKRGRRKSHTTSPKKPQEQVKKKPESEKKLKEIRRQKLKKIAIESKPTKEQANPKSPKSTGIIKCVKTSESRGSFLLQPLAAANKLPPNKRPRSPSKAKSEEPAVKQIRKMTTGAPFMHLVPNFMEKHQDVILSIVKWKLHWLDIPETTELPPLYSRNPIRMCNTFASVKDYETVLTPLVVFDFWFNFATLFKGSGFKSNEQNCNTAFIRIKTARTFGTHMELLCYTYIDKQQKDEQVMDRNLVILVLKKKQSSEFVKVFGVTNWTTREKIAGNVEIDADAPDKWKHRLDFRVNFNVIIDKLSWQNQLDLSQGYCRHFNILPQLFCHLSALKALASSALVKLVVSPQPCDYAIRSRRSASLFVEKKSLMGPLNKMQKQVVLDVVGVHNDPDAKIYLIEGPPGTGKSTVITSAVLEILANKPRARILLLAPSNAAVDSLVLKLVSLKKKITNGLSIKLVRVGKEASMSQLASMYSLDELTKKNFIPTLRTMYSEAVPDLDHLTTEVNTLKANCSKDPRCVNELTEKTNQLENFWRNYLGDLVYKKEYEKYKWFMLNNSNVVCSTIGSCTKAVDQRRNTLDFCIIDEATQCSEMDTLIPISLGIKKLILVGDPQQLPAMSSFMLQKYRFGQSLFERIKINLKNREVIRMLDVQYRMHPAISLYPNKTYYDGRLKDESSFMVPVPFEALAPYAVFSYNGSSINQYWSQIEVEVVLLTVCTVLDILGQIRGISIGIVTPYTQQRGMIRNKLATLKFNSTISIDCDTVDAFQGQEKDVIIMSCVRSNSNAFVANDRRLNVAITRARYGLYLIGAQTLFERCSPLNNMLKDARRRNVYHTLSNRPTKNEIRTKLDIKR